MLNHEKILSRHEKILLRHEKILSEILKEIKEIKLITIKHEREIDLLKAK